jgi:glucose/arabinose dehydrogenase
MIARARIHRAQQEGFPMRTNLNFVAPGLVLFVLAACSVGPTDQAPAPSPTSTIGGSPTLPEPEKKVIPVVQIAEAKGWPADMKPTAPAGVQVNAFASGLEHPRWLYTLPNGDVLVAETAAPKRPEDGKGIRGAVQKKMMTKAGSVVPSANRITLLRDANGDGVAELKNPFLTGLNSPFGMALIGNDLYVANTDAIMKFAYTPGATSITTPGTKLTDLPGGDQEHHRQQGRHQALCHRWFQQQCRRKRHAGRRGTRGNLGSRRGHGRKAPVRHGHSQSQWHGVGAGDGHLVDGRQRTR